MAAVKGSCVGLLSSLVGSETTGRQGQRFRRGSRSSPYNAAATPGRSKSAPSSPHLAKGAAGGSRHAVVASSSSVLLLVSPFPSKAPSAAALHPVANHWLREPMTASEYKRMNANLDGIAAILMRKGLSVSTPAPARAAREATVADELEPERQPERQPELQPERQQDLEPSTAEAPASAATNEEPLRFRRTSAKSAAIALPVALSNSARLQRGLSTQKR